MHTSDLPLLGGQWAECVISVGFVPRRIGESRETPSRRSVGPGRTPSGPVKTGYGVILMLFDDDWDDYDDYDDYDDDFFYGWGY
jgi:hypothetical protein